MNSSINSLFKRLPILYLVAAAFIAANNIWKFSPAQAMSYPQSIIVPLIFTAIGGFATTYNRRLRQAELKGIAEAQAANLEQWQEEQLDGRGRQ